MHDYAFISRAADKVVQAFPESTNFPEDHIIPYIERYVNAYYQSMAVTLPSDTVLEIALTIYRRPNR